MTPIFCRMVACVPYKHSVKVLSKSSLRKSSTCPRTSLNAHSSTFVSHFRLDSILRCIHFCTIDYCRFDPFATVPYGFRNHLSTASCTFTRCSFMSSHEATPPDNFSALRFCHLPSPRCNRTLALCHAIIQTFGWTKWSRQWIVAVSTKEVHIRSHFLKERIHLSCIQSCCFLITYLFMKGRAVAFACTFHIYFWYYKILIHTLAAI